MQMSEQLFLPGPWETIKQSLSIFM